MSEEVTTPAESTAAVAAVKEMHTEVEKEKAVIPIAFSSLATGFQASSGLDCTPGFQAQAGVKPITGPATVTAAASASTAGFGGFDASATMDIPVAGAPATGASPVSASSIFRGFGAQDATIMRKFVIEQNYTIVRTLIQIRRTKHNHPNRTKNHLGFGFLSHDFFKVMLGPMMRSPKRTRTDADIKVAARAWANPATRAAAEITYGHISDWETSQVTNMEKLFYDWWDGGDANMRSFNDDISRWDTSNVSTMEGMFCQAHAFNGDLSRWDTSNVTTMAYMFYSALAFNGDLSRWDTSNVTTMYEMFIICPIETKHKPPRCR